MKTSMNACLVGLTLAALCLAPRMAQAHFLWLVTESQGGESKAIVYFGEMAAPDDPALLDRVVKAEAWSIDAAGKATPLALAKESEGLGAAVPAGADSASPAAIVLRHHYGVLTKGAEPFLLNYYAKTYLSDDPASWTKVGGGERLPLEIVPVLKGDSAAFRVEWKGEPVSGATVTVLGPGLTEKCEGDTDAEGVFRCTLPQAGMFSIRAKHVEAVSGKLDESEYQSARHYSTLTLRRRSAPLAVDNQTLPELPQGVTSFGGAVVDNTLFVYGGNYGSAHEYAHEDQSGDLLSLELDKPAQWQKTTSGPKLQGLAVVAHKGALYRVGGFTAMNKRGEENDLRSQADFARWNAKTESWDALPSLPEPRSSHDAAVVGDTLYVVGGWNMQGGGRDAKWHDTSLAFDLASENGEWREIAEAPFKRRALALAAFNGKLYCLGGMAEKGGPTTAVAAYDPAANTWSEAPSLPGEPMEGFGCSTFAVQDGLYVSCLSGAVLRLTEGAGEWERVGELTQPRFFHRLLPWGESKLIAVGGGNMSEGKTLSVEVISLESE